MKFTNLEDMVWKMNLTYKEREYKSEKNFFGADFKILSFKHGMYEKKEIKHPKVCSTRKC